MSTRESQGRSGNGSERGGCSKPVTGVRHNDKESLRDRSFSGKCGRQEEVYFTASMSLGQVELRLKLV